MKGLRPVSFTHWSTGGWLAVAVFYWSILICMSGRRWSGRLCLLLPPRFRVFCLSNRKLTGSHSAPQRPGALGLVGTVSPSLCPPGARLPFGYVAPADWPPLIGPRFIHSSMNLISWFMAHCRIHRVLPVKNQVRKKDNVTENQPEEESEEEMIWDRCVNEPFTSS